MTRRRLVSTGLLILLASACGQGGLAGTDCPSEQELLEMSPEELEGVSRECDPYRHPSDAPGVTVTNDADDEDGMPTAVALESFGSLGRVISADIGDADDVDFWGLEWPGGDLRVVATADGGGGRVAVTDLEGSVTLGTTGPDAVSELEGSLPAGRYLVRIFAAEGAATPFVYELVSKQD